MRICLTTSGGDAPGLNAVIRGATETAVRLGHEIVGSTEGFTGLLSGALLPLTPAVVADVAREGGTILGAASRGHPFGRPGAGPEVLVEALRRHRLDALIMAGGDGSMRIAHQVACAGVTVVGVPKTIDRDVAHTFMTFGFRTAVQTAVDAIDKLHTTARSHNRLMVVEVMGRDAGHIALAAGVAGGAHLIALPEAPYDLDVFAAHIRAREAAGHRYHILVCAEGAHPAGGAPTKSSRTGRYAGVAEMLAAELEARTGKEARPFSCGHMLRGGSPTADDRLLGIRFGAAAAEAIDQGRSDVMISYQPPDFVHVPLLEVAGRLNRVDPWTSPDVHTARMLGISFGDAALDAASRRGADTPARHSAPRRADTSAA